MIDASIRAVRQGGARRWLLAVPVIPALALLSAAWLPFVNTPDLWLGMPRLIVWCSAWVLLLTPALAAVEYGLVRPFETEEDK
ncbi:hypothetical protein LWF01_16620 [Saxibacter everestensis]|uniref:DUF3311 domain-containing protein n=1 Tax=Saxibacter everestensis TaxID=2909229 RepID=A0ABY8QTY1_9MICO|nr:hypothetical protein LWF01_16620 [Brevibacteriaceae bacterium ZFBP1038]